MLTENSLFSMDKEFEGFVIYNKYYSDRKAFAVVSDDYECKAELSKIPTIFKDFIVPIEDKRFFEHSGIDFKGITRALFRNFVHLKVLEGGSTISQQLARNLLRENSKTISRKIRETLKARELENKFSKDEILNLYFNNIYFGRNIRGLRSASLCYFDKEPEALNYSEVLYLITILRGPNYYIANVAKANSRMKLLSNLLYDKRKINLNQQNKIDNRIIKVANNKIISIKNRTIPFITEKIDLKKKIIVSTLVPQYQNFAQQFVRDSKYPTSVIIIKNKKVVGLSSYYGSDYPFFFKSNVGSTLKPFIYYLAKKIGISDTDKFNSQSNTLNWSVREATTVDSQLNINEALFHSNNNSFINIAEKVGINETLEFLSETLSIDQNELFPSSILGATKNGISLYQLASIYNSFLSENLDSQKKDLMKVMNKIFKTKIGLDIENAFLKTGTTNNNEERLAVVHHAETTFAFLRNENPENDYSKDGSILKHMKIAFISFFKQKKDYKWMK
jgi:membrane peptidoglycan carboxypeptidase